MHKKENYIKPTKYLKKKDVEKYAEENNISFSYAEVILNILKADTKRKKQIIYIHTVLGCSWSDAIYRYNQVMKK